MAKKSYDTFYNIVERNLYSTMQKLSLDEYNGIKDDFYRENVWAEHVVKQLDCWIAFYFKHGRFPGLQKLIAIPQVKTPPFLETDISICPIYLFKNICLIRC